MASTFLVLVAIASVASGDRYKAEHHGHEEIGWSELHFHTHFDNVEDLHNLIRDGMDVHSRDVTGRTPLHHAASRGHESSVATLLLHGADFYAVDRIGWTVS